MIFYKGDIYKSKVGDILMIMGETDDGKKVICRWIENKDDKKHHYLMRALERAVKTNLFSYAGTIGVALYEYRKKHELSQKAFAALIGIDRSYLVQIENGKRIPGREAAFKIARLIRED